MCSFPSHSPVVFLILIQSVLEKQLSLETCSLADSGIQAVGSRIKSCRCLWGGHASSTSHPGWRCTFGVVPVEHPVILTCGASHYPHLCTSDRSSLVLKRCFAVRYNSGMCGCRFCCTHRRPQTTRVSQERQAAAHQLLQLLAQPLLWRHTQVGTPRHGAIGVQPPVTAEPCPFHHRLMAPSSSVLVFYQKTENQGEFRKMPTEQAHGFQTLPFCGC